MRFLTDEDKIFSLTLSTDNVEIADNVIKAGMIKILDSNAIEGVNLVDMKEADVINVSRTIYNFS